MSSAGLYSIEKLDDSNYVSWSVQMKSVLVHAELWAITSGKQIKGEDVSAEEAAAFDVKDEKALASIMLCIKPSQVNHVKQCQTAALAWSKLRQIHQPGGPARKVTLFRQLLSLRLSEGEKVQNHLNEFCDIIERLAEINVVLPDEMAVIILLASLPKSYENFVVAIESRDSLPMFTSLKVKVLEEGARRNGNEMGYPDSQQALVARARVQNSNKNNTKSPEEQKKVNNSGKKRNGKCFNCGKHGHYAAQCRGSKMERNDKSFNILASISSYELSRDEWCIDSGATAHLCCDRSAFETYKERKERIELAGNKYIQADGIGEVCVQSGEFRVKLRDVLHVPDLKCNFVSVSKACEKGFSVTFKNNQAVIRDREGELLIKGNRKGGLFVFKCEANTCFNMNNEETEVKIWHNRFGHLNFDSLTEMFNKELVHGLKMNKMLSNQDCVTCAKCKICVKSFPRASKNRAKDLLEVIHSDVCGPMNKNSIGGSRYFVTFIDDKSRYVSVYF